MTITIERPYAAEIDRWCRDRNGLYYGYGEAFTTDPSRSTDCSGLVLQTGARWMKRTDWPGNRYGSTESFRLDYRIVYDLGFRRMPRGGVAALSFKPIMLVGLQHGGGGIYSHTACTLFHADKPGGTIKESARGIDWESRGGTPGVRYYDGARAWNDPLFHDFWYFDGKLAPIPSATIINEINACETSNPWLGKRGFAGERACLDGEGRYVDYQHGAIYWHPQVRTGEKAGQRAVAVPGQIFDVWRRQSWEQGPLGYPIRPHVDVGGGVVQAFQGGAIYRQAGTPGAVMHGAILARYAATGWESGPWGWPVGDETQTADGGREQKFSKATAIWHPSGVVTLRES